ncbi:ComF family protein [Jannaschia formosa]|uniref:ComF family protein n=1 Tax=Jannaschia formosa TaxID=2259592 RepID=UPI000E1B7BC6|nr:ComF family protein [Jannaschia formosa]TFL19247.1 ComF family protein [Jannaschia formosa]
MIGGLQRTVSVSKAAAALREALYPRTCLLCQERVEDEFALCPACWSETPFISGAACDLCGTSLPGAADGAARCDDCLTLARPWDEGRAVLSYAGGGRRMVLSLKHGDRTELARAAARWIARRAGDLIGPETVFVPVPIHRWRLLKRRYNQSALIASDLARITGGHFAPEALRRVRQTPSQDHKSVRDRFANLDGCMAPGREDLAGRHVALIDDVMTSGATLAASSDVIRGMGAARITVLMLARVAKDA